MSDVLVLNSDGNPLSIIPLSVINWQEAIKLIYQNKVAVIENYAFWTVHSPKMAIQVPSIVMTKKYCAKSGGVRFTKQNLIYRDGSKCQYCGEHFDSKDLTIDHVIPRSHNGKKTWNNVVMACKPCNHGRGNDVSIQPLKIPSKPTYYQLINERKKFPITIAHESWNLFLNWPEELIKYGNSKEGHFNLNSIKDLKI